jgi:hypothetical protein
MCAAELQRQLQSTRTPVRHNLRCRTSLSILFFSVAHASGLLPRLSILFNHSVSWLCSPHSKSRITSSHTGAEYLPMELRGPHAPSSQELPHAKVGRWLKGPRLFVLQGKMASSRQTHHRPLGAVRYSTKFVASIGMKYTQHSASSGAPAGCSIGSSSSDCCSSVSCNVVLGSRLSIRIRVVHLFEIWIEFVPVLHCFVVF